MNDKYKIGVVGVAFALLPLIISPYLLRVFKLIMVYALFTMALNVVFGHTDQLYLFVGGLAGVSSYVTILTASTLGVSPWTTLILGITAAALIGGTVSYIAARKQMTIVLIAIFTLAFQLALSALFVALRSVTGGSTGKQVPPLGIQGDLPFYYLFVGLLIVAMYGYVRLINSHYGMAFNALREDELAARSTGVNTVRYKTLAGIFSSALIGSTGVLYAFSEGYVTPSLFTFQSVDTLVLIMVVIGSMRTLLGPIVGAVLIYWIDVQLSGITGMNLIIFGLLIIVLFLYFREGIVVKTTEYLAETEWYDRFRAWVHSRF